MSVSTSSPWLITVIGGIQVQKWLSYSRPKRSRKQGAQPGQPDQTKLQLGWEGQVAAQDWLGHSGKYCQECCQRYEEEKGFRPQRQKSQTSGHARSWRQIVWVKVYVYPWNSRTGQSQNGRKVEDDQRESWDWATITRCSGPWPQVQNGNWRAPKGRNPVHDRRLPNRTRKAIDGQESQDWAVNRWEPGLR